MLRWFIGLCLLLAACAPQPERPAPPPEANATSDWTVVVDGRPVRVHLVRPDLPPPWPTAMVLHGSSGLGDGTMIWPVAQALADRGVAAAVVEYFEALPDRVGRKGAVRHFERRERLLARMVVQLLAKPEVQGRTIGVFGYSLGAFHGVGLAATEPRVAAVAALGGGLPRHIPARAVAGAAPVLLMHGTRDRVVPYSRTQEAEAVWRRYGRRVSVLPLAGTGHEPGPAGRQRLAAIAADFLAKELLFQVAAMR